MEMIRGIFSDIDNQFENIKTKVVEAKYDDLHDRTNQRINIKFSPQLSQISETKLSKESLDSCANLKSQVSINLNANKSILRKETSQYKGLNRQSSVKNNDTLERKDTYMNLGVEVKKKNPSRSSKDLTANTKLKVKFDKPKALLNVLIHKGTEEFSRVGRKFTLEEKKRKMTEMMENIELEGFDFSSLKFEPNFRSTPLIKKLKQKNSENQLHVKNIESFKSVINQIALRIREISNTVKNKPYSDFTYESKIENMHHEFLNEYGISTCKNCSKTNELNHHIDKYKITPCSSNYEVLCSRSTSCKFKDLKVDISNTINYDSIASNTIDVNDKIDNRHSKSRDFNIVRGNYVQFISNHRSYASIDYTDSTTRNKFSLDKYDHMYLPEERKTDLNENVSIENSEFNTRSSINQKISDKIFTNNSNFLVKSENKIKITYNNCGEQDFKITCRPKILQNTYRASSVKNHIEKCSSVPFSKISKDLHNEENKVNREIKLSNFNHIKPLKSKKLDFLENSIKSIKNDNRFRSSYKSYISLDGNFIKNNTNISKNYDIDSKPKISRNPKPKRTEDKIKLSIDSNSLSSLKSNKIDTLKNNDLEQSSTFNSIKFPEVKVKSKQINTKNHKTSNEEILLKNKFSGLLTANKFNKKFNLLNYRRSDLECFEISVYII